MPIIIWGTRGITSTLDHGEFYCPCCGAARDYARKKTRPFFTIYFIPLFPIGGGDTYVECATCGQPYAEEVLTLQPPRATDQLHARVYEELRSGMSVEDCRDALVKTGMAGPAAQELLRNMCDNAPRACACGRRYHPEVERCAACQKSL